MSFGPALANFIRTVVGPVDYFAQYPAKVLAQNADNTLELQPDSPRLPGLSGVPMRGLPGVVAKVKPGARVLVGFENGSPDAPVAMLAEPSGLLQLTISADVKVTVSAPLVVLADGVQQVARVGDTVTIVGTAGPFPVSAVGTIATGNPKVLG